MRRVMVQAVGLPGRQLYRVSTIRDALQEWLPDLNYLVKIASTDDALLVVRIKASGVTNLLPYFVENAFGPLLEGHHVVLNEGDFEPDDIVAIAGGTGFAQVLYRHSDVHHAVFLTNRCNSYCLMCSQPPTRHDDSWLVNEAIQLARFIRRSPPALGFSGGEPLLLGRRLREVLETFRRHHPDTIFEVLTNGRRLESRELAAELLTGLEGRIRWLVPLYGQAEFLHDFVVQSAGAFEETLAAILNLQQYAQPIQLRIVLIEPVLKELSALCSFIVRSLPFVQQVALMGCEPIGFALANRGVCEVDLADWQEDLSASAAILRRGRVPYVFMNTPLCALPEELWSDVNRSISDWKQVYSPECQDCSVQSSCPGLFAWYERGWKPTAIKPILRNQTQ